MAPSKSERLKLAAKMYDMNGCENSSNAREALKRLVREEGGVPSDVVCSFTDELKFVTEQDIDDLPWDGASGTIRRCRWCDRLEDGAGPPMRCCGDCKKKGTYIWYCNRECQKVHWKRGPHKTWCRGRDDAMLAMIDKQWNA